MTMLLAITLFLWEMLSSSIGQLCFWATATILTFLYALIKWRRVDGDEIVSDVRVVTCGTITVFWTINAGTWYVDAISLMLFTDTLFLILALLTYRYFKMSWLLVMAGLYFLAVVLDLQYRGGMSRNVFAWCSNIVYAIQLITASGFYVKIKQTKMVKKLEVYLTKKKYLPFKLHGMIPPMESLP